MPGGADSGESVVWVHCGLLLANRAAPGRPLDRPLVGEHVWRLWGRVHARPKVMPLESCSFCRSDVLSRNSSGIVHTSLVREAMEAPPTHGAVPASLQLLAQVRAALGTASVSTSPDMPAGTWMPGCEHESRGVRESEPCIIADQQVARVGWAAPCGLIADGKRSAHSVDTFRDNTCTNAYIHMNT